MNRCGLGRTNQANLYYLILVLVFQNFPLETSGYTICLTGSSGDLGWKPLQKKGWGYPSAAEEGQQTLASHIDHNNPHMQAS